MTHRYLPWVRRGLAASIETPDDLGNPVHPSDAIAERAQFDIGVEFNNDFTVDTALLLHGPGDVTGVDTRVIIRTDPERYVSDFEPNNMCSVEFDQPDFPWMFTPASADDDGRLRPWLVLVVVENRAGVTVGVQPGAISPVLEIKSPALSEVELPDLADSWAWAHAQVITENEDIDEIADEVTNGHDRNLSRLLCPRRLKANRQYFACVVPAFETGRLAGLGETIPAGLGLTPAWGTGGPVRLPVYFHWEFGTSNGGSDFEDLVDRIEPRELAESAGTVPMYVGEPGQGITPLAADEAVLGLEGALRPITASGSVPSMADVSNQLREDLRVRLNAAAEHLAGGASADAAPVGPPIYGAYHAATHEVSVPGTPLWIDDLNQDPRLRTIAALGASIVRDNQEELMDEAWAQVGDVISANQLLNQAALSKAAAHSAYSRHLEPLPDDRLFSITAPAHARIKSGSQDTVRRRHDRSHMPNAATDPAFRRATSPQSRVLRRALRRAGAGSAAASAERGGQESTNRLMAGIDDGSLPLEDLSIVPDGIGRTQVFDHLDQSGGLVDMGPIGGAGSIAQSLVRTAGLEMANLSPDGEPDPPLVPRRAMDDSGLITTDHMESAARALGNEKGFLLARVGEAIASLRPNETTTGLQFIQRPDGSLVPELIGGGGMTIRFLDPAVGAAVLAAVAKQPTMIKRGRPTESATASSPLPTGAIPPFGNSVWRCGSSPRPSNPISMKRRARHSASAASEARC